MEKHGGVAAELMTHEQLRMMRSFFDTLDADSDSEVRPCPMRVPLPSQGREIVQALASQWL